MKNIIITAFLTLCIFSAVPVAAHKMRLFAYGNATTISGEAAFGSRPAKNIEVVVSNEADGTTLVTTLTDELGNFTFAVPGEAVENRFNLLIIANAGEGHRSQWRLAAEEYLPASTTETAGPAEPRPSQPVHPRPQANQQVAITEEQLKAIVDQSVAEQLRPLQRQLLLLSEKKTTLQDIIGGIGYILGLAGIAAYMRSKKEDKNVHS